MSRFQVRPQRLALLRSLVFIATSSVVFADPADSTVANR
jgi:hypothetical protein